MNDNNLIQNLKKRGLIAQITNDKKLTEQLAKKSISIYCGFDPTANSLHLGHLVPLLCLKRFQMAGHRPIVLIGGATGLIGDPSFKTAERKSNTTTNIQKYIEKIKYQLSLFLDFNCGYNSAIIVNNYEWFNKINVLTFLRDIGKYFSINQMIKKEAINYRLNRDNIGISFTEFSYNLLQSFDFAYLNKKYEVLLQIGGSDQWGNITSGINLIHRMHKKIVYGLTVPLITNADGIKFNKTDNESIWLDPQKTSPYKFYQFWINTTDEDVYQFLKFFTFLELSTIEAMEKKYLHNNISSHLQCLLAEEITRIVHGEQGFLAAERITKNLFTGSLKNLTKDDFCQLAQDGMPSIIIQKDIDLQQALVLAKLAPSRGQAKNMICSKAISINGVNQTSSSYVFTEKDKIYGYYTIIRRGKKHYCLINWQ